MAYAINFYTGNGSTTTYSLTFPYISQSDVEVKVNNVTKTLGTDYTFPTSSTITFTTAPANGLIIKFTRTSNRSARLVDYQDGSTITEAILDQDSNQMFYMAQEAIDITENTIALADDDKFDANNKVIKNLANPVNSNDAVNKTYLENTWLSITDKATLTNLNANIANVNAVNSNATNINAVNANSANINIVSGINSAVSQVASINADVTQVSAIYDKVTTVANNIADINQVYTDILKVVEVANDLQEATSEIDTVANAIANVDFVGNSIANVNTVATNINNVNSFFQQYKVSATQPSSPSTGDLWYDTANSKLKIYTGSSWNLASDYLENLINEYTYNITGTPTTVSGADANTNTFSYTVDSQVNVFLNGIRLVPSTDYVLSGGNTITFTNPLQNGDVVFAQVFTKLTVAQEALLDQKVIDAQTQVSLATAQVALATTQATNSLNSANASEASRLASESARDLSQTYRDNSQTYATNSANSATASANSATAAANSATSAQNSLDTFNDKFIASASAPSSPSDGDLWYDTVNVRLKIYIAGSGWQNAGAYLEGLISRYTYTATSGQTVFSVSDNSSVLNFTAEANVFVFLNGVRLTPISDYTLSGTNTCTLPSGVQVGDILYIEVITKISLTEEAILQGYVANALSSKNDAETAKTQAETAETNAETAETNAVAAKNASESARDLAEQYRDTASNHATTATTQAGIATTKASEAVTSASQAAASATQASQSAGGGTLKITPNDTTADNLSNKVVGGNGITVSVLNASGNEDLNFALSMTETSTTPTAGQTNFTVTYTVGYIQVFLNGIKLIKGTDFTATNGTSVVLASGATTSDVIEFVVWA